MKNSAFSAHCADLTASDHRALADARLRRAHEALADQLIERRFDRDRIATLKLEVQDLKEQVGSLRRALDAVKRAERRSPSGGLKRSVRR